MQATFTLDTQRHCLMRLFPHGFKALEVQVVGNINCWKISYVVQHLGQEVVYERMALKHLTNVLCIYFNHHM